MPKRTLDILVENFEASDEVIFRSRDRFGFGDWMRMTGIPRPDLKSTPFAAPLIWRLDEDPESIFDLIRYQDVLLHHHSRPLPRWRPSFAPRCAIPTSSPSR